MSFILFHRNKCKRDTLLLEDKTTSFEYNVLWWSEFYKHTTIDELAQNKSAVAKLVCLPRWFDCK
jgi:hypothetical protein